MPGGERDILLLEAPLQRSCRRVVRNNTTLLSAEVRRRADRGERRELVVVKLQHHDPITGRRIEYIEVTIADVNGEEDRSTRNERQRVVVTRRQIAGDRHRTLVADKIFREPYPKQLLGLPH